MQRPSTKRTVIPAVGFVGLHETDLRQKKEGESTRANTDSQRAGIAVTRPTKCEAERPVSEGRRVITKHNRKTQQCMDLLAQGPVGSAHVQHGQDTQRGQQAAVTFIDGLHSGRC